MRVDSYIETLLRKWGKLPRTGYLGYPKESPYFKEYRPKGYREDATDLDRPEAERLGDFISANLSPIRVAVLRIRYEKKIRNKRVAARKLRISEQAYRDYFRDCIKTIESRFLERVT